MKDRIQKIAEKIKSRIEKLNLSRRSQVILGSVFALALLLLIVYLAGVVHYSKRFLSGTSLNGTDLSGKTIEEAQEAMQESADSYVLSLTGRNSAAAEILGGDIALTYVNQGELEQLLREQEAKSWMAGIGKQDSRQMSLTYTVNEEALNSLLASISFLQAENMEAPANAYVTDNGQTYEVASETEGTWLETEPVKAAVLACFAEGASSLDLDAAGLYTEPSIRSDDQTLNEKAAYLNSLLALNITYDYVDRQYVVNGDVIRSWMVQDENGDYVISSDLAAAWVYDMAYNTDTFGNSHVFTTHDGQQIQLAAGGDYGWAMDQEETTAALLQAIAEGYSGTLEPSYLYTALDRSSNDIGGTYVEICIAEQVMYLYEDYQLKAATYVITGNHSTGYDTPSGSVWAIDAKKYEMQFSVYADTVVTYWLPFNGECGIHDASWRQDSEYGNPTYYLTSGSHGCINTPTAAMETVFDTVEIGYPVIVYYSAEQPVGPEPTQDAAVG